MKLSTQTKTSFLYHSGAKQPPKCCINALAVVLFYNYNFVDSLEFFTKVGLKKQNVTFAFCFFSLNLGKKMETTPKFKSFLVKLPLLFKLHKRHFYYRRILENKKCHVIIFLVLKSAKIKGPKHS